MAFNSHKNYSNGRVNGFFDDLILPIGNVETDGIPRSNTSLEQLAKLNPVFDNKYGQGSITAGNSSLLSDGVAGLWVCGEKAKDRFSTTSYAAQLVDWEINAVNIEREGLLMATTFALPRLLARHKCGTKLSICGRYTRHSER
ncbi:hypothetical protein ACRASX_12145 [Flavobacterium sp. TMP13]|uniref:thiolase family protein n=1 Tax=Flavobacterium sp. TMP13 TaxID=3425950 RepID=UPI003D7834F6